MTVPELSEFEGRWSVSRVIDDRRAGQTGRFAGTAVFAPVPGGLAYAERGLLELGGASFEAERRYAWRAEGGGIAVYFDDGRFFHRIGLRAAHWCDPDDYRAAYDFAHWPRWRAVWTVSGPRKNYTMTSDYAPLLK